MLARQHTVDGIVSEFKSIALACTCGTGIVVVPADTIKASSVVAEPRPHSSRLGLPRSKSVSVTGSASVRPGSSRANADESLADSSATASNVTFEFDVGSDSPRPLFKGRWAREQQDVPWSVIRFAVGCMDTVMIDNVAFSDFAADPYFRDHLVKVKLSFCCVLFPAVP